MTALAQRILDSQMIEAFLLHSGRRAWIPEGAAEEFYGLPWGESRPATSLLPANRGRFPDGT